MPGCPCQQEASSQAHPKADQQSLKGIAADQAGNVLPEMAVQMGEVPLVPYATPGTDALPDAMAPWLPNHDAFLLANHGATTLGYNLAEAHQRMESLEHGANILLTARLLGRVNALGNEDARILEAARRRAVAGRLTGEWRAADAGSDA